MRSRRRDWRWTSPGEQLRWTRLLISPFRLSVPFVGGNFEVRKLHVASRLAYECHGYYVHGWVIQWVTRKWIVGDDDRDENLMAGDHCLPKQCVRRTCRIQVDLSSWTFDKISGERLVGEDRMWFVREGGIQINPDQTRRR